ncbi:hypothetical protein EG329_007391 [Mollisiaceae sp. DMI_Dod_QoI]|nr:hypothetical protein EG329_007391 [Helotiales sp. DMI_Dod_QoI]
MKCTFIVTLVFTLFTLTLSHIIPLEARLLPEPLADRDIHPRSAAKIPTGGPALESIIDTESSQAAIEARYNDCGSSPYQNPCSAGNKMVARKAVMGVLGIMAASVLL